MFYLKACPKCRGDLVVEQDFYGSFFRCFQCGLNLDVEVRGLSQNKETAEPVAGLVAWRPAPYYGSNLDGPS